VSTLSGPTPPQPSAQPAPAAGQPGLRDWFFGLGANFGKWVLDMLLQIGAERALRPAGEPRRPGLAVAREAVVGWLAGEGLRFPELVIDNGAGLSRAERIAPASLAALLRHVAARDWGGLLRESLPRVGQDGTMRHRLVGEAVAGRAWIKTGSLDEVRSIAGYVDTASGRRVVAVLLVNGPAAAASAVVQDRLLRWVHAQA